MARTLDPVVHAVRRETFVDIAQRLIQTKGYEQMSIQDVLDEAEASRGAFYHYFDSKAALLEAVVERMVDTVIATLSPLVADQAVPALEKLQGVFTGIARWKGERTQLMVALMEVWLSDDNAIVREKFRAWPGGAARAAALHDRPSRRRRRRLHGELRRRPRTCAGLAAAGGKRHCRRALRRPRAGQSRSRPSSTCLPPTSQPSNVSWGSPCGRFRWSTRRSCASGTADGPRYPHRKADQELR